MAKIEMLSPRTAIRRRVCALLRAALPAWDARVIAARVHESRAIPLSPKKLPAVLVYTRDERLEDDAGHGDPGPRHRTLELAVEVVTSEPAADADADYLCAAVEAVMDNNETLGQLVEGIRLKRIMVDVDGDGEAIIAAARMEFEVTYWTRPLYLPSLPENGVAGGLPEYVPQEALPPDSGEDSGGQDTAPLILGLTRGLGEDPATIDGSAPPQQILASIAPYIGPEHETAYEPATIPGQGFD